MRTLREGASENTSAAHGLSRLTTSGAAGTRPDDDRRPIPCLTDVQRTTRQSISPPPTTTLFSYPFASGQTKYLEFDRSTSGQTTNEDRDTLRTAPSDHEHLVVLSSLR
jgi:hypothetical protein